MLIVGVGPHSESGKLMGRLLASKAEKEAAEEAEEDTSAAACLYNFCCGGDEDEDEATEFQSPLSEKLEK